MTIKKDAADKFDHTFSYDLNTGEVILTSVWSATPTGLTLSGDSTGTVTATTWLEDGTEGTTYTLYNTITTNQGRIYRRKISVIVQEINVS